MNVSEEVRQAAALDVSRRIDHAVRVASRYGQTNGAGFDELMAMSAIANALGTWFCGADGTQFKERLECLVAMTQHAYLQKRQEIHEAAQTATRN